MTSQELKILCLSSSARLPALIKSVYGAIPHKLIVVQTFEKLYLQQQKQRFDLFVLDIEKREALGKHIQKIRLANPAIHIIIIEENYDRMEQFVHIPGLFFISRGEMLSKLPLILGEAYSVVKKNIFNSLDYFSLLKSGFDSLRIFVVIISGSGQIIFMNKAARDLLHVEESDYANFVFQEIVSEGEATWKYLKEQCLNEKKTVERYKIDFKNGQNEVFSKSMVIEPIILEKSYLLLQECGVQGRDELICAEREYELLNNFADSVANELLNPVNVFSGRLQMLAASEPAKDEYAQKNIAVLRKQVERINELMDKLLTFARLKQNAIPQKINFNELLKRVLLTPSLQPWLNNEHFSIEFDLDANAPVISGLLAQFDLLMKLILDLGFNCLGSEGKICIQTTVKDEWLSVKMELFYERAVFGDEATLESYLGRKGQGKHYSSIESTIIRQLLHQYNSKYTILQEEQNKERLELLIPVTNSK